jgi:uncharacterized protein YdeI (YjbR/CyaY-like superfamily)
MGTTTITTTLVSRGPGTAIVLDDAQVALVGDGAKRFPVAVTVHGHTWRTTVARMRDEFLIGLSKEVREAAGVKAGDTVHAEIALDAAPREVQVPAALAAALAGDPQASARFEALAYTHRKEYARWIAEAKRDETRENRISQALQMLREGRTRS